MNIQNNFENSVVKNSAIKTRKFVGIPLLLTTTVEKKSMYNCEEIAWEVFAWVQESLDVNIRASEHLSISGKSKKLAKEYHIIWIKIKKNCRYEASASKTLTSWSHCAVQWIVDKTTDDVQHWWDKTPKHFLELNLHQKEVTNTTEVEWTVFYPTHSNQSLQTDYYFLKKLPRKEDKCEIWSERVAGYSIIPVDKWYFQANELKILQLFYNIWVWSNGSVA